MTSSDHSSRHESGHGWRPAGSLVESAYAALYDMDDVEFERFECLSEWRKVAYRYIASDCDAFSVGLYRITGWPIVGNVAHRLNLGTRGLVDASGWVTVDKLKQRYMKWWSDLGQPGDESQAHSTAIGEIFDGFDDTLADVVSAIRQLPWAPFSTKAFQKLSFRPIAGVDHPSQKSTASIRP